MSEPAPAVFAVDDIGYSLDADGERRPTVVIDASAAPEVADLARVHAIEGIGDIATHAIRSGDALLLGVRLSVPVMTTFVLAFDLTRHREFLTDVVAAEVLVIAHTDPTAAEAEHPLWLAVDIDGPALAAGLADSTG